MTARQLTFPSRDPDPHDCDEYTFRGTGCVKCGMNRWRETRLLGRRLRKSADMILRTPT